MSDVTLRLAWRNLWRHGRRTWLTVGAMIFSNALLVFSISLQFGSYDMMIDNTLEAYTGHLQLQHPRYLDEPKMRYAFGAADRLAGQLRTALELDSVAVRAVGFALVSSADRSHGVQLLGVEPGREPLVSSLPGLVGRGRYLEAGRGGEIVIGATLARNLRVAPGDELSFIGSGFDDSFAAGVVRVVGILDSGNPDIDRAVAEIELEYFREIFALGDRAHEIVVRAPRLDAVEALAARARGLLGARDDVALRHWDELQPGLRQAIRADMASAWFMYFVLILLVAFSVLNTQLMSVLERTREFGTMMALGLRPSRLARLVMLETALLTALGLALGIFAGLAVTAYFSAAGFTYPGMGELAERFNLPDRMYPALSPLSLTLGPAVVALGSLLAAAYPALKLYRLAPIEAMRAA